ncbi:unnamed protein product [Cunninghamella blakesleeana]
MSHLDIELTKDILERIPNWKKGITPSGELAKENAFVQKNIPAITTLTKDHSTAYLVTHSSWTQQLVKSGVLWDHNNDSTLQSLSIAQFLFYPHQHSTHPIQLANKQFHMLYYETCAWFPINHILRPTIQFQKAIIKALIPYSNRDYHQVLKNLNQVFNTFGFLWPQKIILGHRIHVKKNYKALTDDERLMRLRIAKDEAFSMLCQERNNYSKSKNKDLTLEEECLTWTIIKRNDVCPIYEFLDENLKQQIKEVINICFYRIPIHAPIKLCNYATKTYLSWRKNKLDTSSIAANNNNNNKQSQQQQKPKSYLFGALPLEQMKETSSQYLWRFTWTPSRSINPPYSSLPDLVASYQPQFLKCNSSVYISPACDTPNTNENMNNKNTNNNNINLTHAMILSRSLKGDSRTRSIDLLDIENHQLDGYHQFNDIDHDDYTNSHHYYEHSDDDNDDNEKKTLIDLSNLSWKVELPGLGLGRDDDSSTDEGLNMDILIGRNRPIIHRDLIALRQVLYLCALPINVKKNDDNSNNNNNNNININNKNSNSNNSSQQTASNNNSNSNTPHGVIAKENSIVTKKLEQCWTIELPSKADFDYHQRNFVNWPPDIISHNNKNQSNQLHDTIKRTKSEESLRLTNPTLRRVQSLKQYFYHKNNNNKNSNSNNSDNKGNISHINNNHNKHNNNEKQDLFNQFGLGSSSSLTIVTSPNSQVLSSPSLDSSGKLSLIIEEDEERKSSIHKSIKEPSTSPSTDKRSQSLNLNKIKSNDHHQSNDDNRFKTIDAIPLQRSLSYFSTETSPSPPSQQQQTLVPLNQVDHFQIGHVNTSSLSIHDYYQPHPISAVSSSSNIASATSLIVEPSINDKLNDELGFDNDISSTDQMQPYLQLYISKQKSKTLSHIWKNSSLKLFRKIKQSV